MMLFVCFRFIFHLISFHFSWSWKVVFPNITVCGHDNKLTHNNSNKFQIKYNNTFFVIIVPWRTKYIFLLKACNVNKSLEIIYQPPKKFMPQSVFKFFSFCLLSNNRLIHFSTTKSIFTFLIFEKSITFLSYFQTFFE